MTRNLERYRAQLDRCCGPAPRYIPNVKAEAVKMWDELIRHDQLTRAERIALCTTNTGSTT